LPLIDSVPLGVLRSKRKASPFLGTTLAQSGPIVLAGAGDGGPGGVAVAESDAGGAAPRHSRLRTEIATCAPRFRAIFPTFGFSAEAPMEPSVILVSRRKVRSGHSRICST